MATRFGGVVKAAVEAVDGLTFLEVKLRDLQAAARDAGGRVPAFLMTSFATHDDVVKLAARGTTAQVPVEAFPQLISLRLQPNGELFRDREGALSPYAPGHGDLPEALHRAGILDRFRASGGELLFMSNVDNLTATLDPAVIGAHLAGRKPVTTASHRSWRGSGSRRSSTKTRSRCSTRTRSCSTRRRWRGTSR
jgi:UTP--glucose-1-phosphate uridylyltransferase